MNFLEQQKASLDALIKNIHAEQQAWQDTDTYLGMLVTHSIQLAQIVHMGQKDKAGKPYIQHVTHVANKASNLLGFCIGVLHDVKEDGEHLGITLDLLKNEILFPAVIVDGIDAISRRDEETYSQYLSRLCQNYQAIKVKIEDSLHNSNVARFDYPTRQNLMGCQKYLEKVEVLKTNKLYQSSQPYEYLHDLVNLHQISPMRMVIQDNHDDGKTLYQKLYFGYKGYMNRRYTLIVNGVLDEPTGKVVMRITAFPSMIEYSDNHIFKPRKMELRFDNIDKAREYIEGMYNIAKLHWDQNLHLDPFIRKMMGVGFSLALQEQRFEDELDESFL